ncbi:hypothetical protein KKA02_00900, partial [Patescibacteria group bacterium]|nr:hypothetical protein [Patescibacteria group bacterium]
MPKSIRLFIFSFIFSFLVFFSPLSTYAASPGINIINYVSNAYHVPDESLKSGPNSWMVYIPNHPSELNPNFITADNVVIRIHAAWTEIGKLMLGTPQQQQQAASDWCSSINSFAQSGKNVYIEPFNELEHDYERISPQGTLDLSTAISRAQNFISLLRSCTSLPITSPALDPQSADFGTTSSAFSNFNIISCHPYRMDTLERCKSIANGKQLIFTEIGVDKGGVKYDDCLFIEFFCDEGFIEALQNTPNLIAYFLFTVSPGNYAGFWQLTNPSVVKALKGECTGDLTCETTPIEEIVQMIEKVYQHTHLGKMAPFIGRSDRNNGIRPGPLTNTATGLLSQILANFSSWWVKYFTPAFSHVWPFHYTDLFSEQYAEDACPISGDICSSETLYNIKQADWEIVDDLYTLRQSPTVGVLTKYAPQTDGHNPANLRQSLGYFGPGWMFSLYNYPKYLQNPVEKQQNDRDFFDFKSGVYSRASSAQKNDIDQVNDFLCKLACSGDTDCINRHPSMVPVYDTVIAYLKVTEKDFKERFPNASYGIGDLDRSQAEGVDNPIPIRISNIFCFNPDALPLFLDEKCAP